MAIKWQDFNSVNIKILDEHHKQMAEILERLSNTTDPNEAAETIKQLTAYAAFHFAAEEQYFKDYDYPEKEAHIKQHHYFQNKIKYFQDKYKENRLSVPELLEFLSGWWINHINNSDMKYSDFLNRHGVF